MASSATTARDLIDYLTHSPTPYHAVESSKQRLLHAGFTELHETNAWSLVPGGYFIIHGSSTLIAFVVPEQRQFTGFRMIGAHTDSPNLRLKPKAAYAREGYAQFGVEVYGGALLNSWLDRDLSLAGRCYVRAPDGSFAEHLVQFHKPVARVTQLAIHLDRDVNDKGLVLNRQEHLAPIVGLGDAIDPVTMCALELGVEPALILRTDLMLYDTLAPAHLGVHREFIASARLDNLAMCHAGLSALLREHTRAQASGVWPVLALFDHEEVGSESATGAASMLLPRVLERVALAIGCNREEYLRTLAGSYCLSADMAHAVHPNYPERHEARHRPHLNGGPVIKINAQQRYATSSDGAAMLTFLAQESDIPIQQYAHRTDLPCGSTIGPITATHLAIRTVDIGNPMLSMHSIRELCGTDDQERMVRLMAHFFSRNTLP